MLVTWVMNFMILNEPGDGNNFFSKHLRKIRGGKRSPPYPHFLCVPWATFLRPSLKKLYALKKNWKVTLSISKIILSSVVPGIYNCLTVYTLKETYWSYVDRSGFSFSILECTLLRQSNKLKILRYKAPDFGIISSFWKTPFPQLPHTALQKSKWRRGRSLWVAD